MKIISLSKISQITMNHNNSEINIIHNSRKVLCEQLKYRGYDVSQYENGSISETYTLAKNEQLDILVENQKGKKCYVTYATNRSLRENNIYDIIDQLIDIENVLTKKDDIIIITKDKPNQTIQKALKQIFYNDGIFVTVYSIMCLQFNVLEHDFVPNHEIVEDKQGVYDMYNIADDSQVPEISRFDPVSIAIGLQPGQLCKIIRKSKSAISSDFYRVCV